MNLIKNRKLKTKLSINIVITTIMLIGLGATSFLGFRHVATLSDNMVDNNVAPNERNRKNPNKHGANQYRHPDHVRHYQRKINPYQRYR